MLKLSQKNFEYLRISDCTSRAFFRYTENLELFILGRTFFLLEVTKFLPGGETYGTLLIDNA